MSNKVAAMAAHRPVTNIGSHRIRRLSGELRTRRRRGTMTHTRMSSLVGLQFDLAFFGGLS